MTAYDNTIQDNAVQDRKKYRTSKHYISIGEGLRKSFNMSEQNRTVNDTTDQFKSSPMLMQNISQNRTEKHTIRKVNLQ